ncbi:MAG: hypothetical protein IKT32_00545 [Clostridia bacterium]|nr:hypothetical protein [Clostridia bacterium]
MNLKKEGVVFLAAIQSVIATINGQTYTLNYNSSTDSYEASITAPTVTSYNQTGHYYPITVTATDVAGNSATINDKHSTFGTNLQLRVKETVKPVITLNSIGTGAILTTNAPLVEFTVTDTGAGVNKDSVVLKIDNKTMSLGTPTAVTNGFKFSYSASGLSDGAHTIIIDASDNDGNAAQTFTRSFTIDTVPPTLNITAPTDNLATNANSVTVTGATNDATSSPVTVAISVNGVDAGTVTVGANGAFSKTVTLQSGENRIVITATDAAGKSTTITRNVLFDTSAPEFSSVTVAPNPVNTGATYTITVKLKS